MYFLGKAGVKEIANQSHINHQCVLNFNADNVMH